MLLGGGLLSPSAFLVYNVAKVRRLSTKFQVDTCKTKKKIDLRMRSCAKP